MSKEIEVMLKFPLNAPVQIPSGINPFGNVVGYVYNNATDIYVVVKLFYTMTWNRELIKPELREFSPEELKLIDK